jgi:transcriptional regulator with XRE-family HTH domain
MMSLNPLSLTLRTKILGVLIRDARLASRKSLDECAKAVGVTPEAFEAIELGEKSLTLPQLEVLAYTLNVPLEHFWGRKTLSENHEATKEVDLEQLLALRQRMIGAMLRQARLQAQLSLETVAESVGISPEQLQAFELAEAEIPLALLEALCAVLNRPIAEFLDKNGPVGVWANQQRLVQDFLSLPAELQAFVSRPINRPYIELAQRLSEMSVDKLRAVGEGILEITL